MAIKNLITNKTKIIELKNKACTCNDIGIANDVFCFWNNWYKFHDKWYYFKKIMDEKYFSSELRILNELIGEYLAKYLDIDTIHYDLAKLNNNYGLASENFIKKGSKYCFLNDISVPYNSYNTRNILLLHRECKNFDNYQKLVSEIFKQVAIDIYMNQTDRSYSNLQFRITNGELHLAPLYDFEESFRDPFNDEYRSNLLGLSIDDIKDYHELTDILNRLLELNIINVIDKISEEKNIIISSQNKEYYKGFVEDRKMLLKSVF